MVRIALLQLQMQEDTEKSVESVIKLLKNAEATEPDIVCLPEQWYPKNIENFEEEFGQIIDVANKYGTIVIAGAFMEYIKNIRYISCPVIDCRGRIIGRQLKIHPFGEERKMVQGGNRVEIFAAGKYKFGISICHDIVFPEVSRAITRKGADLIFYPSRIREGGIIPWHLYLQVRALENRIPVVAPNICNKQFGGKSMIVDLEYDEKTNIAVPKRALASVNEQILVMDIDIHKARRTREIRFQDVKNDIYKSL